MGDQIARGETIVWNSEGAYFSTHIHTKAQTCSPTLWSWIIMLLLCRF